MNSRKIIRSIKGIFVFLATFAVLWFTFSPSFVYAQTSCSVQNTFPASMAHPVSEAGDRRISSKKGKYKHTGNDFFYPAGQKIIVPDGCKIQNNSSGNMVWEQNNKKSNGEPAGYGYYMVLDCGTYGGDTVKMMLAHVPKNPYNAATKEILQGTSGNAVGGAPHYHTEIIIGNRRVDPQCVLGMAKTNQNADEAPTACLKCPNVGPANLCDASSRNALISHGGKCFGSAAVKGLDGGSVIDPDRIRGSGVTAQGDIDSGETHTGHSHGDGGGESMDINDLSGGTGYLPAPPLDPEGIPPVPISPLPPVPGIPGGAPNLVPAPDPTSPAVPLSGCAADTWTAMVNQAVMETRREDLVNKRFIVKPDSVLDYSCFSEQYTILGERVGPIFSESNKWDNIDVDVFGDDLVTVQLQTLDDANAPFFSEKDYEFWNQYTDSRGQINPYKHMSPTSLDMALDDVITKALNTYITNNFRYGTQDFLAGSSPVTGVNPTNCNIMDAVWSAAKCKHFDGNDIFYSFEDLVNTDPREFPTSMRCF